MKLNYGVIGTGMMGCEHIRNLKKIPDVSIVAIADPNEESRTWALKACEDKFKIRLYEDYKELLAQKDIDVVVVASPNFTHIEVMRELFKTDKHVLLEKPMCTTFLDGLEVLKKSKVHEGLVWIGLEYRFMSPIQTLIKHIEEIGDIRMKMLYPPDHWLHSAEYYVPSMSKRFERDWVWAPGGGAIMKDWLRTKD